MDNNQNSQNINEDLINNMNDIQLSSDDDQELKNNDHYNIEEHK